MPPSPPDDPHHLGHRDRLRARFAEAGDEALADYELLELVLFRSIPRRDVKPLAKTLIRHFGSFAEVLAAPVARLRAVDGVGESAALDLKIVESAARRLAKGAVAKRPVLSSWSSVLDYCRTAMAFAEKEQFRILFLDKRNTEGEGGLIDFADPMRTPQAYSVSTVAKQLVQTGTEIRTIRPVRKLPMFARAEPQAAP